MSDLAITLITIVLIFWTVIWLLLKWWKFLWGRIFKFVRQMKTEAELAIFTHKFERNGSVRERNQDADATKAPQDPAQAPGTAAADQGQ